MGVVLVCPGLDPTPPPQNPWRRPCLHYVQHKSQVVDGSQTFHGVTESGLQSSYFVSIVISTACHGKLSSEKKIAVSTYDASCRL